MCRLAYFPSRKPFWVKEWLIQLEKSAGGNGNGVVTGGQLTKGLSLCVSKAAKIIEESGQPALFHTRLVSCGPTVDDLCHPFQTRYGWLAHNGHWVQGAMAAEILNCLKGSWSDSKVFALLADKLGFYQACERFEPMGVWLMMSQKGRLSVYVRGGSLYYHPKTGIVGSVPPSGMDSEWVRVPDGFYSQRAVESWRTSPPAVKHEPAPRLIEDSKPWWSDYDPTLWATKENWRRPVS